MREVVKTLKKFAEEKKQMEKMQEQLFKESENPSYKIQILQKLKDDNNKLLQDKIQLKNENEKV